MIYFYKNRFPIPDYKNSEIQYIYVNDLGFEKLRTFLYTYFSN